MAKVYYDLIKLGLRTVESVPMLWRNQVIALLEADSGGES